MRGRVARLRTGLSREEQAPVTGRRQYATKIGSAGRRVGIRAAEEGLSRPGRGNKRRQCLADIRAEDTFQLLDRKCKHRINALPLQIEREIGGKISFDDRGAKRLQLIGSGPTAVLRSHHMRIVGKYLGVGNADEELVCEPERQARRRLDLLRQGRPEGDAFGGQHVSGHCDDDGPCPQLPLARRKHDMVCAAMVDAAHLDAQNGRHRQAKGLNQSAVALPHAPVRSGAGIVAAEIDHRGLVELSPGHEGTNGIDPLTPRIVGRQHGRKIRVIIAPVVVDAFEEIVDGGSRSLCVRIILLQPVAAVAPGGRRAIDGEADLFGNPGPGVGARAM